MLIKFKLSWIQDYHVIVVYGNRENGYRVLDFDSTLPFAVTFEQYASEAVRSDKTLVSTFHRYRTWRFKVEKNSIM